MYQQIGNPPPALLEAMREEMEPAVGRLQTICTEDLPLDEKVTTLVEFLDSAESEPLTRQTPEAVAHFFPDIWERVNVALASVAAPYC